MKKNEDEKNMKKMADDSPKFRVRFEGKTEKMLTAGDINALIGKGDRRRFDVLNENGDVILTKRFRG